VKQVYHIDGKDPLNEELDEITTQENRSIVFPNLYQQYIGSFQ